MLTQTLKLTSIGNSVGVILPKDLLGRLNVDKGDTLYVTPAVDGVMVRAYDQSFAEDMEMAKQIMREDRDVLRKLAE